VTLSEARLFREIAQTRSITRAAAHCGISQSAATQHLQEVEKRLGADLVDRRTRPLALTGAGKLYAEFCRDILRRQERFQSALGHLKGDADGTVQVASIYSIGLSEMTRLRAEFKRRHPRAHLHVDYLRPEKIYEAVLQDQADLGLVSYPVAKRELAVIPWRQEQMAVAMAPSHPLAGKARFDPADLQGQDFIGFDEDLMIRRELDRFLREQGVAVRMLMQFDNIQTIKEAVALGQGISILPERTMEAEIEQGRLVSIPLDAPGLLRPLGIIHRKRKQFNLAAQAFLKLLKEQPAQVA